MGRLGTTSRNLRPTETHANSLHANIPWPTGLLVSDRKCRDYITGDLFSSEWPLFDRILTDLIFDALSRVSRGLLPGTASSPLKKAMDLEVSFCFIDSM